MSVVKALCVSGLHRQCRNGGLPALRQLGLVSVLTETVLLANSGFGVFLPRRLKPTCQKQFKLRDDDDNLQWI